MKYLTTALVAAFVSVLVYRVTAQQHDTDVFAAKVETRELVIVDEHRRPTARFRSNSDRTLLQFYGVNGDVALEVGVVVSDGERYVRAFHAGGQVLFALNSLPPDGQATLYLGDKSWTPRLVLGALNTDIYGHEYEGEWGMHFALPGSGKKALSMLVRRSPKGSGWNAGIRILRQHGGVWIAP